MKKATTKIKSKTPSSTSMSQSVTTTSIQKPRSHASGIQQLGGAQQRKVTTVSSKASVTSVTLPGGQRRIRTEESVTTKIEMPIAQAAQNWQGGLRSSGIQQPRQSYAALQQQRQQQAEQAALEQRQAAMPKLQIPRAIPRAIATLAQAQYGQLMDSPPPLPQQKRMMQAPQVGGGQRRQMSAMPPPQQQQRQRQQMSAMPPPQQQQRQRQQMSAMPPTQQQQRQHQMQQPQQQQRQQMSAMPPPQQQQRQRQQMSAMPPTQQQQSQHKMQQPQQQQSQKMSAMPPPQQQQRQRQQMSAMPPTQQQQSQHKMQQPQQQQRQKMSAMPPPQQQQRQRQQMSAMPPTQQQQRQRQMQQPQQQQRQRQQMSAMPPPQQQQRQRQQMSAMPPPQQQQRIRQGQQPQVSQSRMQQPRSMTGMVQPKKVIATAAPASLLAQATAGTLPRQSPPSPGTLEFEMFEGFSPETMQEYETFEHAPDARHRTQLQPQNRPHGRPQFASPAPPRPTVSSTADQQYAALMSTSPPQQPQPRRMMQQPGFMRNVPQEAVSTAAAQQYAALMDSPEQRTPSPTDRSMRQSPQSPQSTDPDMVADISIPTAASGQPTALELGVENALMNKAHAKPGMALRADGQIQRLATPQESPTGGMSMVQTPMGLLPAETQLLLEGTVRRTPTEEVVTRHVLAVEGDMVDERETVHLSPGKGIKRPKTPESMELIVCSSEVKMAAGYRETTTRVVYETTDEPSVSPTSKLPAEVTPHIVSQLVLEETADVDRATKLHAPDLKHSSPLTYGIKKRVNALQLNKMDVKELEDTVTWPPPRADQAQDEPLPELLASMMMTEEKGLAMGSTPDQLYSALFGAQEPVKADEGTVEVNSVAMHPLNDVVVPAAAASRDLHFAALTPELATAAVLVHTNIVNTDDSDMMRPSDGAYAERVLGDKKEAMEHVKVKNVGHRDGPPVKYPVFFDADKAAPWEVDKFDAVIKQVGAIPTSILECSVVGPSSAEASEELRDYSADGIEYLLNMDEVSHQSNVQLRGTQLPSWFPGYVMVLGGPHASGNVTIARSPSMVLAAAYKAVQPDTFNDDSIIAV